MDITKYMKHLPTCNIMQDWTEAEAAIADTPDKFRDPEWAEAREEMDRKKGTCTCGLEKRYGEIQAVVVGRRELLLDFFRNHCKEYHDNWTDYDVTETVNRYLKKQAVSA